MPYFSNKIIVYFELLLIVELKNKSLFIKQMEFFLLLSGNGRIIQSDNYQKGEKYSIITKVSTHSDPNFFKKNPTWPILQNPHISYCHSKLLKREIMARAAPPRVSPPPCWPGWQIWSYANNTMWADPGKKHHIR